MTVKAIPPLRHGDRLSRAEFERRYGAMPHLKKAELLDGLVYIPPRRTAEHGEACFDLIGWLGRYTFATPAVEGSANGTVRLDSTSEPQPDAHLRLPASCGSQARVDADGFVAGPPELAADVVVARERSGLEAKVRVFAQNGIHEYIAWRLRDREINWFVLRRCEYQRLEPGEDGVLRSEGFPGLWLDAAALVRGDVATVSRTAQQGIASPEHADFVRRLAEAAGR